MLIFLARYFCSAYIRETLRSNKMHFTHRLVYTLSFHSWKLASVKGSLCTSVGLKGDRHNQSHKVYFISTLPGKDRSDAARIAPWSLCQDAGQGSRLVEVVSNLPSGKKKGKTKNFLPPLSSGMGTIIRNNNNPFLLAPKQYKHKCYPIWRLSHGIYIQYFHLTVAAGIE